MKLRLTYTQEQALVQTFIVALGLSTVGLLLIPYVDLTQGLSHARLNFYSVEDDKRLGRQSAERIHAQNLLAKDPFLNAYLQQLGEAVAAVVAAPEYRFQFRILNKKDLNAQAFPGGFIYVNLGLLQSVRNEGELAGVLAHEVGHVVARHGTKQLSRNQLVNGAIALGGTLVFGPAASPLTGLVTNLGKLSYSRWEEEQADDLAVDYLYTAGYHPETMATFLDLLWQRRGEVHVVELISSHPLSEKRAARARWRFSEWPLDSRWLHDTARFHEVKAFSRSAGHVLEGYNLLRQGDLAEAQDEFEKALAINPRNGEAHYGRALALMRANLNDLALGDLKTAIDLNPDLIEAYEALDGLLAQKGEWDAIAAYWTRYIELHPENGKAYFERGGSYYRKGDTAHALQDAEKSCNLGYREGCQIYQKLTAGSH